MCIIIIILIIIVIVVIIIVLSAGQARAARTIRQVPKPKQTNQQAITTHKQNTYKQQTK